MFFLILFNKENNILNAILEQKYLMIIEICLIILFLIYPFIKNKSIALLITSYIIFTLNLHIFFSLGDKENYKKTENSLFIILFTFTFPIFLASFLILIGNIKLITKGSNLKIEENIKLKIEEIEKILKQENRKIDKNICLSLHLSFNLNELKLIDLSNEDLIFLKNQILEFEEKYFKFSFKNFFKFFIQKQKKSLIY
jgi:hypothetical protein